MSSAFRSCGRSSTLDSHQGIALPAPKDKTATLILPNERTPYLDQAVGTSRANWKLWSMGNKANRISADLGFVQDAKLFRIYVRLYERLAPDRREELRKERQDWLGKRQTRADAAVESHGGSLAPLELNNEFIEVTATRIKELERRLSTT